MAALEVDVVRAIVQRLFIAPSGRRPPSADLRFIAPSGRRPPSADLRFIAPSGRRPPSADLRFIASPGASLRREDEQKSRELAGLLPHLSRIKKGAHVVDAAAGKASVGLVAAELLPLGRLTVLERDPARVAACRHAAARLGRAVPVDVRHAELADDAAWPAMPDAVVALHACGGAADLVIDGAVRSGARQLWLAPCCYGNDVPFHRHAAALVARMPYAADDLLRRRMAASIVDLERKLRLEVAGYETDIEEFVAPTVTPHNLFFHARKTDSQVRIARAETRLQALRDDAS